jgi:hypothetical protein
MDATFTEAPTSTKNSANSRDELAYSFRQCLSIILDKGCQCFAASLAGVSRLGWLWFTNWGKRHHADARA